MDKNQEEHHRRRIIKNIVNNQTAENFPNENNEQNINIGNDKDIEIFPNNDKENNVTIKDNPNIQNNIEPQITIDNPPPLSNEPIIQNRDQLEDPQTNDNPYINSENQNQIPPQTINNNPNINIVNPNQQIGYQNPNFIPNQMYPQNQIIIIQRAPIVPSVAITNRYSSIRLICPYCNIMVNTVSFPEWTCNSCCKFCELFTIYLFTLFIAFLFHLCCMWCYDGDYCCYEAIHRCPNCNNIIARRIISERYLFR